MEVDYLIAGGGIAGTLLSHALWRRGRSFMLMDDGDTANASHVAAAVINPMAGKHWAPSPGAEKRIPLALDTYRSLESILGLPLLKPVPIYVFPGSADERQHWLDRQQQYPQYLVSAPADVQRYFEAPHGAGSIDGAWLVDGPALLRGWRDLLQRRGQLIGERLDYSRLELRAEGVGYGSIRATQLVCCEGAAGRDNPLFPGLPFTDNRGEALLLEIPGLPGDAVYHRDLRLVPRSDGLFWYGSNYRWQFTDMDPDPAWRATALAALEGWLRLPCRLVQHMVARRPTTAGQQVLAFRHPEHPALAVFNGLGTRGFSAGPSEAEALAERLERC